MVRTARHAIPSAHAVGTIVPVVTERDGTPYAMRSCPGCGREHLLKEGEVCPRCSPPNPFGAGPMAMLVDAGGEDSPHPERIADGSHRFNMGLPPNGNRPVANAELHNNAGVREYAKRHGLEPMTRGRYRGLR
jgi:hypothetical protein